MRFYQFKNVFDIQLKPNIIIMYYYVCIVCIISYGIRGYLKPFHMHCRATNPRRTFHCVGSGLDSSAFGLVSRWEPASIDIAGSARDKTILLEFDLYFDIGREGGSLALSVSNSCTFQFIKTNLRFLFVSLPSPSLLWIIKLTPDCL